MIGPIHLQKPSAKQAALRPTGQALAQPFDVIVIGGGVNGSGIARDAAERGMKVLLVEKNDFGAGASTYNSRLIHGGLRYCENLEFGLVRESLRERERLLHNAPHLVNPLPFGIPIYEGAKRGTFIIRLGMMLYDMLSYDKSLPRFQMLGKQAFLKAFPGVQDKGLKGGAVYYDAQANLPERLCVENVLAAKAHGAVVMNHAQVETIVQENQRASGIRIKDLVTGESLVAHSKRIVNASGAWVDDVLKLASVDATQKIQRKIGGTKGSHLIVTRFPGGPDKALYVEAKEDGRPFFIIPWREKYYLIGTTDLPYKGDLDKVVADQSEMDYLKRETRHIFPNVELDVLYTYSGIRPLPYSGDKKVGKITRKHIIYDHGKNEGIADLFSIIGGKLTTFRNLAEETVTMLGKQLKMKLPKKSPTRNTPLPGGVGVGDLAAYKKLHAPKAVQEFGVSAQTAEYLISVYGSRYNEILALTRENPAWKTPLQSGGAAIQAQVVHAVRHELAMTSADVLMRRTGLALEEGVGLDVIETTAQLVGHELGWTEEQVKADVAYYQNIVNTLNKPIKPANPVKFSGAQSAVPPTPLPVGPPEN